MATKVIDPHGTLRAFVETFQTQEAAAEALEISGAHLSRILSGARKMPESVLDKLGLTRVVVKQ